MTPLVLLLIGIPAFVVLVLLVNGLRFDALVRGEIDDLLRASVEGEPGMVTEEDLVDLPDPVRAYLVHTGTTGRERARTMRIEQRGVIRMRPGGRWLPFLAEQHYSTEPVAFVWSAKVKMGPLTLLRAMDSYKGGKGHMVGRLMSTFKVVDGSGREMDEGSLMRFLNEMMWFPSFYLDERLRWEPVNERSARATIEDGGMEVSATLQFDGDGRMVDFESPRYMSTPDGFKLEQWSTPVSEYRSFDGRRLPGVGSAVWKLASGDFTYIWMELTRVEINPS